MMWTVTVELKNLVIIPVTVELKNHRIIRVGKELWRSSSPKLLPWQHSPQVYQSLPSCVSFTALRFVPSANM